RSDSNRAALHDAERCAFGERDEIRHAHPPMLMKVRHDPAVLRHSLAEVHDENATIRLEHAPHLLNRLRAHVAGHVMEHHRAEDDVESRGVERQRFGARDAKGRTRMRALRLLAGPLDHIRRRVDSVNRSGIPYATIGRNSQRPRSAPHVEHRLAGRDTREVEHSFAHRTLSPEREQFDQQIVLRGAVNDAFTSPVRHCQWFSLPPNGYGGPTPSLPTQSYDRSRPISRQRDGYTLRCQSSGSPSGCGLAASSSALLRSRRCSAPSASGASETNNIVPL